MTNIGGSMDFQKGFNLVKKASVDRFHVLPYSARKFSYLLSTFEKLRWLEELSQEERDWFLNEWLASQFFRDGEWILKYYCFKGLCIGFILSGFGLRFLFIPYSQTTLFNALFFHTFFKGKAPLFEGFGELFVRFFLEGWLLSCGIALQEKIEKMKKEKPNSKDFEEIIQDEKLFYAALSNGDFETFAEIRRKYKLPTIEDVEAQSRLLRRRGLNPPSRFYSVTPLCYSLWENIKGLPIIFFSERTEDDEVLAQMAIWAYRQGKTELSHLYRYLQKWCRNEDLLQEVIEYLLQHWKTPRSEFSFRSYCRLLLRYWRKNLLGREVSLETDFLRPRRKRFVNTPLEPVFPCSVFEAALFLSMEFPEEPESIKKWLYRKMERGAIPGCIAGFSVSEDGYTRDKRMFQLTEEGFEKARELLREKNNKKHFEETRSAVVKIVMKQRNVGRRAAQRWVKRRLDAGKDWEEIAEELGLIPESKKVKSPLSVTPKMESAVGKGRKEGLKEKQGRFLDASQFALLQFLREPV
ncbi:hypothetical protein [Atrimonas thermophila]|uniref:hypothetical protein n=1 Tax=Atrimonas thermophila TaxID=3064161 RepID=UPI00399C79DF